MPDQEITINDEERDLLERVRQQQGLESIEQAAEWLAKRRLRNQARQLSGRGRALYVIGKKASA
jgi:phosphohistidine phosphatase SixA